MIRRQIVSEVEAWIFARLSWRVYVATSLMFHRMVSCSVLRSGSTRTTVIIAHRISAVQHADGIIVHDEGTIVQRGTHEQLLAAGGNYASLHAIQRGDI